MLAFRPLLALTALSAFMPMEGAPCIPDPGSIDLEFPKPSLQQAGIPVSAVWPNSHPNRPAPPPAALEDDPLHDDPMGAATASADGSSASVTVTNIGGNLFGPNGVDQNGVGEGDCIEVKVCWTYLFQKTVSAGFKFSIGDLFGGGSRISIAMVVWDKATICSESVEACPCPPEA